MLDNIGANNRLTKNEVIWENLGDEMSIEGLEKL